MSVSRPDSLLRVLAVGDIVGKPGRTLLKRALPLLKRTYAYEALVVNVENAAGGFGTTSDIYKEFCAMDIHAMTGGNHTFDKKGTEDWISDATRMLRPANLPQGTAGQGTLIFETENGTRVAVINIMARVFMRAFDCPFRVVDELLERIREVTNLILVDFHGEATSEKMAMGWYLAKRVSAIWGTHTHIPTADARILEGHTGYITDLGMTGPYDSVIGMAKESIIQSFTGALRPRFEVAKHDVRLGGCLFDLDRSSGRCIAIQPLFCSAEDFDQMERDGNSEHSIEIPGTATMAQ